MTNKIICNAEDLTAIADAVRASNGSTNTYNVPELSAAAVNAIGTGGTTVQSDWAVNDENDPAYVKNRTHYDAAPLFDIVWDGVIGDRFALDMSSFGFPGVFSVKMDDRAFTLEEMFGATINLNDDSSNIVMPEHCNAYTYPGVYDVKSCVVVVYDSNKLSSALGLPSGIITNGTYFYTNPDDGIFTAHFVSRNNSKKLDIKYLPEGYPYISEPKFNIIWDGNMEGRTTLDMTAMGFPGFYFVKVSDEVIAMEDVIGASYAWCDDSVYDGIDEWAIDSSTYPGAYHINSEIVVLHTEDQLNAALGLPEGYLTNGVYFCASPENQRYVTRLTGKTEVHKLDEMYLPDNLNRDLAVVATTGNYYDLNNLPNVYSKSEVDNKISNIIIRSNLPEVTTTDNGKFLRVVNGVWTKATINSAEEATFGV